MLKRAFLCFAVFGLSTLAQAGVDDLASWSLRFPEKVDHRQALTGCYGTASYNYVLPTVEYVKAYRRTLAEKAGELTGFAFTREENSRREPMVVDLQSGEVSSIPFGSRDDEGVAFCLCRNDYTQARYRDGRPNCSASAGLPPLGETFLAVPDSDNDDDNDGGGDQPTPQPIETWVDRVTGWTWSFMSPAATWREAKALCGENLPTYNVIGHAARRIWSSPLGTRIYDADANKVWSSTEFDWYAAFFVYVPDGDAAATNKDTLLPVLCVNRGDEL
jgi:hypothetical protein